MEPSPKVEPVEPAIKSKPELKPEVKYEVQEQVQKFEDMVRDEKPKKEEKVKKDKKKGLVRRYLHTNQSLIFLEPKVLKIKNSQKVLPK